MSDGRDRKEGGSENTHKEAKKIQPLQQMQYIQYFHMN